MNPTRRLQLETEITRFTDAVRGINRQTPPLPELLETLSAAALLNGLRVHRAA